MRIILPYGNEEYFYKSEHLFCKYILMVFHVNIDDIGLWYEMKLKLKQHTKRSLNVLLFNLNSWNKLSSLELFQETMTSR